jgi:hypothetical protein
METVECSASNSGRFSPWRKVSDTTLRKRLGGAQSRSGHFGEKKNILHVLKM